MGGRKWPGRVTVAGTGVLVQEKRPVGSYNEAPSLFVRLLREETQHVEGTEKDSKALDQRHSALCTLTPRTDLSDGVPVSRLGDTIKPHGGPMRQNLLFVLFGAAMVCATLYAGRTWATPSSGFCSNDAGQRHTWRIRGL